MYPPAAKYLRLFDRITPYTALFSAIALLALLFTGRVPREYVPGLLVLAAGLLGNAMIFGGLSSPADRYQARLIWLVPAMLTIVLAAMAGRDEAEGADQASPA